MGRLLRNRSEEHTSELQSLMRNSYAVFCLKKKKKNYYTNQKTQSAQRKQIHQTNIRKFPPSNSHITKLLAETTTIVKLSTTLTKYTDLYKHTNHTYTISTDHEFIHT